MRSKLNHASETTDEEADRLDRAERLSGLDPRDRRVRQLSICVSPHTEMAWPEIVLPRGEQMNTTWSAICCGVT
jgi:hypothetical protein